MVSIAMMAMGSEELQKKSVDEKLRKIMNSEEEYAKAKREISQCSEEVVWAVAQAFKKYAKPIIKSEHQVHYGRVSSYLSDISEKRTRDLMISSSRQRLLRVIHFFQFMKGLCGPQVITKTQAQPLPQEMSLLPTLAVN